MRSRDEVLREFPVDLQGIRDSYMEISAYHVERMADRLRELEQEVHEDQGVITVWRGRTERAETRIRELEAQVATVDAEREQAFQVAQHNEQTARELRDRLDRAERLAANAWDELSRMALAAAIVLREEQA